MRKKRAQSMVEVAVAAFVVTAVVAIALDATIFTMAFARLDATTRDAARAAATQPRSAAEIAAGAGTTCAAALASAQSQLVQHATDGVFIQQPTLTGVTSPYFIYQDFAGAVPANETPYVLVTCSEVVILPVPINFFGASFGPFMQTGNKMTLQRQYVCPIVKTAYYAPS